MAPYTLFNTIRPHSAVEEGNFIFSAVNCASLLLFGLVQGVFTVITIISAFAMGRLQAKKINGFNGVPIAHPAIARTWTKGTPT